MLQRKRENMRKEEEEEKKMLILVKGMVDKKMKSKRKV